MGKQVSTMQFTGKVGNVVGSKGNNGTYVARIYTDEVKNPQTPEQMFQRGKLALAAKVAGMLGVMGEQVLVANGYKANRRGTLVRSIMAYINDAVTGPELGTSLPLVRNPQGSMTGTPRISVTAPTSEASGSILYANALTADRGTMQRVIMAMLVYNSDLDIWQSRVDILNSDFDNAKLMLYISKEWGGTHATVYGYALGIISDPTVSGAKASLGNMAGNENKFNLPVDTNNVVYGGLCFTQIDAKVQSVTINAIGG